MPTYKTPDVYVEEISTLPPSVAEVSTAIPAFIGYTEKAVKEDEDLTYKPTRITTLLEYKNYFGGPEVTKFTVTAAKDEETESYNITKIETPQLKHLMYYSVDMYFKNGGGPCYIVSVGDYNTSLTKGDSKNPGLQGGLDALRKEDEPTLIVLTDAILLSENDYYELCKAALKQCGDLKDRFTIIDVRQNGNQTNGQVDRKTIESFRSKIGMDDLKYGAAYYPYLKTLLNYYYTDDSVTVVNSAPAPKSDSTAKADDAAKSDSAAKADDTAKSEDTGKKGGKKGGTPSKPGNPGKMKLGDVKEENTGLYNKITAELNKKRIVLPSSSAVAGAYAKTDNDRGVWKAPANVSLASVLGPTVKITSQDQEDLNVDVTAGKSINAIRSFTGKGTLVWGARTLDGNSNEWRYVPVRRLFNMIEESIQKSSSFVVFEPNTAMTWLTVRTMIENYLEGLWRKGALAGSTPEQAFFVNVGLGTTMTQQDILEGRMIIEVGIAAVRPAEFIILRFSHKLQEA